MTSINSQGKYELIILMLDFLDSHCMMLYEESYNVGVELRYYRKYPVKISGNGIDLLDKYGKYLNQDIDEIESAITDLTQIKYELCKSSAADHAWYKKLNLFFDIIKLNQNGRKTRARGSNDA